MSDLDFERKHAEDLQRLRGLRLLDDDFMNKVFEDKACAEFLLQIILQRTDLRVQRAHGQHGIKNLQGRSVRLDILAVDETDRVYNIEVQRSDKGAGVKRARYNSSLIDANVTEPGDEYEKLNETYVIFITEHDVLGDGHPIYHIDRTVRETGALFGDESHILYVNAQIKDDTALGQLMHDFSCTSAEEMHYQILADRVRYFKEDTEGVATMCKVMEDMRNEAAREADKARMVKIAQRMLNSGKYTYEEMRKKIRGRGGMYAHLGTSDCRVIEQMIRDGDRHADLIFQAQAYQIAKAIGLLSIVLKGDCDAIILTGGVANSKMLTDRVTDYVKFIAPVCVMPGENEMEALALGGMRILQGEENARIYHILNGVNGKEGQG